MFLQVLDDFEAGKIGKNTGKQIKYFIEFSASSVFLRHAFLSFSNTPYTYAYTVKIICIFHRMIDRVFLRSTSVRRYFFFPYSIYDIVIILPGYRSCNTHRGVDVLGKFLFVLNAGRVTTYHFDWFFVGKPMRTAIKRRRQTYGRSKETYSYSETLFFVIIFRYWKSEPSEYPDELRIITVRRRHPFEFQCRPVDELCTWPLKNTQYVFQIQYVLY